MSKPETPCLPKCYRAYSDNEVHHMDACPNAPKAEAPPKRVRDCLCHCHACKRGCPCPEGGRCCPCLCSPEFGLAENHDERCPKYKPAPPANVSEPRTVRQILGIDVLTAERDALKAQNAEMSEKIEWGKKVEKALKGDAILARTERNKAQAEVERLRDLKADVDQWKSIAVDLSECLTWFLNLLHGVGKDGGVATASEQETAEHFAKSALAGYKSRAAREAGKASKCDCDLLEKPDSAPPCNEFRAKPNNSAFCLICRHVEECH